MMRSFGHVPTTLVARTSNDAWHIWGDAVATGTGYTEMLVF